MGKYSINPASIIDEAIDLSTRLSGTAFPISIFPAKIQRIIREVHECHNTYNTRFCCNNSFFCLYKKIFLPYYDGEL